MARRSGDGYSGYRPNQRWSGGVSSLSAHAQRVADGTWPMSAQPADSTWTRPADWLPLASVSASENKVSGLYAIMPDNLNTAAFSLTIPSTAPTALTVSSSTTDNSSYSGPNTTHVSGTTYFYFVQNTHGTAATDISSATHSSGSTMTKRATVTYNGGLNRLSVWSVKVVTGGGTQQATFNFGGVTQTSCIIQAIGIPDAGLADDNIIQTYSTTGSGTAIAGTMSATANAQNAVLAVVGRAAADGSTPGTGWTEVRDQAVNTPNNSLQALTGTGLNTIASTGSTSAEWGLLAVEVGRHSVMVDWGDGTTEAQAGGTISHTYSYAGISGSTLTAEGYKQAVITATPTYAGGTFSTFSLQVNNPAINGAYYADGWLDLDMAMPAATSITFSTSAHSQQVALLRRAVVRSSAAPVPSCWEAYGLRSVDFSSSGGMGAGLNAFRSCYALTDVTLSYASGPTTMSGWFYDCWSLTRAPLIDTSAVTTMTNAFNNCYSLREVPNYSTASLASAASLFQNCYQLQAVPMTSFPLLTSGSSMFSGASSLRTVGPLYTPLLGIADNMFRDSGITRGPRMNTASITNASNMFMNSPIVETPAYDFGSVTNASAVFSGCTKLQAVPALNLSSATTIANLFAGCVALRRIGGITTSASLTNASYAFQNCYSLASIPSFTTSGVTNFTGFLYGTTIQGIPPGLDISAATTLGSMFSYTRGIPAISLALPSSVTSVASLADNSSSVQTVALTNTAAVTDITRAIYFGDNGRSFTMDDASGVTSTWAPSAVEALQYVSLPGMRYSITYGQTSFTKAEVERQLEEIGKAASGATYTVGTPLSSAGTTYALSGTTTSGSTTVTMASTLNLAVGMEISGTGISSAAAVTFQDTGDTVTRTAHGLTNGTRVSFATITSTTGISTYTPYYVVNAAANTFQVALTAGGSALALTTDGSGTVLYGTTITAINPNVSVTLSVPASASGTVTTTSGVLKRSIGRLKGWTVT